MNPKKQRADTDALASELSTSAFFPTKPTNPQTDKTASTQNILPTSMQFVKYTTHLPPALIKKIKVYASLHDMKDYEVATEAFGMFFLMHGEEDKPKVE